MTDRYCCRSGWAFTLSTQRADLLDIMFTRFKAVASSPTMRHYRTSGGAWAQLESNTPLMDVFFSFQVFRK
ncbi:hypothetical protein WJX82_008778 [Trebouxia sp. C0006]